MNLPKEKNILLQKETSQGAEGPGGCGERYPNGQSGSNESEGRNRWFAHLSPG